MDAADDGYDDTRARYDPEGSKCLGEGVYGEWGEEVCGEGEQREGRVRKGGVEWGGGGEGAERGGGREDGGLLEVEGGVEEGEAAEGVGTDSGVGDDAGESAELGAGCEGEGGEGGQGGGRKERGFCPGAEGDVGDGEVEEGWKRWGVVVEGKRSGGCVLGLRSDFYGASGEGEVRQVCKGSSQPGTSPVLGFTHLGRA